MSLLDGYAAFPLRWPDEYARTASPQRSRFDCLLGGSRFKLVRELELLGSKETVVSTNIRTLRTGAFATVPEGVKDTGVAVYYVLNDQIMCMACDRWDRVRDNIHALELSVAAIRGLERWGSHDIVSRAMAGFAALPEHTTVGDLWWYVLDVQPNATLIEIEQAFKQLAKHAHPDAGGSVDAFVRLQRARDQAYAVVEARNTNRIVER